MAETSSRSSEFPVIDYKKASSKDVQRVLVQVTGQKKWENADSWKFYLVRNPQMSHSKLPANTLKKSRNTIFNNIAKSSEFEGLDWRDPDSWTPLEEEYISRSKQEARPKPREGEIPLWALDGNWMDSYPEIVQWMRREHWRNNKAKLIDLFNKRKAFVYGMHPDRDIL
jgi:hypothetical protein